MGEEERKLCLVEVPLELTEEMLLQVQMQLLGAMQDMEALAAEADSEAEADTEADTEATAEQEVMGAAAVQEEREGWLILTLGNQEQEVQEVLAVLGGEAEEAVLEDTAEQEVMVVMAEQEVMVEVEGVAVLLLEVILAYLELMVAAALVALD